MKLPIVKPNPTRTVITAAAATHIRNAIKIKIIPYPDHANAALVHHQGMYATGILKNALGAWMLFESASSALAEIRKIRTDIPVTIERSPSRKTENE